MLSVITLAALLLQLPAVQPLSRDSANALRKAIRRAESQYESLSRRLVPHSFGGSGGGPCDEVVGRFCLTYDPLGAPQKPIPPESPRVAEMRKEAIEVFRNAFRRLPSDLAIVRPFVRYLVEDARFDEAITAASEYEAASRDSVWGPMLRGFALHAAGSDSTAEREMRAGIERLAQKERSKALSAETLLAPKERALYKELEEADRRMYEDRLWRNADALFAVPGNETRAEHYARYIWSRMFEHAPVVMSMQSWGSDLDELTVRYGVPKGRVREDYGALGNTRLIERYDPASMAFVPETLSIAGFPAPPPPGTPWDLENPRARAAYTPGTMRRLIPMHHQVTRFFDGDTVVLRVDAEMVLDSVARGAASVDAQLFVADSTGPAQRIARSTVAAVADTFRVTLQGRLDPRTAHIYSAEVIESASRLAGRARYALPAPPSGGALRVSDLLIAEPFEGTVPESRDEASLHGRARLLIDRSETIGVYAEVDRPDARAADSLSNVTVELVFNRQNSPAAVGDAVRWLGRLFGRSERNAGARMSWTANAAHTRAIIAVDVSLASLKEGLYEMKLTVHDGAASATSVRLLRVLD